MSEKPPEKFESDITFSDVQKETTSNGLLDKGWSHPGGYKGAVMDLPVEAKSKQQMIDGIQGQFHLLRLLSKGRSEAERSLGLAYLESGKNLLEEIKQQDYALWSKITDVIAVEGYDTTMFWTYAPYLYTALLERGIDSVEAVKRILLWAQHGQIHNDRVNLKGLEEFNINRRESNRYILSDNPQGASHIFTRNKAHDIIENLFLTEEEKNTK